MSLGIELDFKIMEINVCWCRPAIVIILMTAKEMKFDVFNICWFTSEIPPVLYFLRQDNGRIKLDFKILQKMFSDTKKQNKKL